MVALLNDQDSDVRSIEVVHVAGSLAQAREGWSDEQMLVDLEDDDSLARERSGIVLAYRRQQMNDNLPDPRSSNGSKSFAMTQDPGSSKVRCMRFPTSKIAKLYL